ncbi:MAG: DUF3617 family protein [Hyphomicrobium sp.]|jgi:hypothetical protein
MRLSSFAVSFLAIAVSAATAAAEDTLPARRAGLWELKTVMDEGNGPREQALKICIDASMEANTLAASAADHKANCTKYEVKTTDGVTTADGECKYNGRDVISRTEMSGDFKQAFNIKISSTTSDATKQQSIVIKRTISQTGNYLSESCGDLKAGEAMGTDGSKIAVQ